MARLRTALGSEFFVGHRSYAFLTADAVEVDDVELFSVTRTRVLLEDVTLVALYRLPPWGLFWTGVLLLAFVVAVAAVSTKAQLLPGALLLTLPLLAVLLVSLLLGVHYVEVFGQRSRARVAWRLSRRHARNTFALVVERVAAVQGALSPLASESAAEIAAPLVGQAPSAED